jgi:hypothetical protein
MYAVELGLDELSCNIVLAAQLLRCDPWHRPCRRANSPRNYRPAAARARDGGAHNSSSQSQRRGTALAAAAAGLDCASQGRQRALKGRTSSRAIGMSVPRTTQGGLAALLHACGRLGILAKTGNVARFFDVTNRFPSPRFARLASVILSGVPRRPMERFRRRESSALSCALRRSMRTSRAASCERLRKEEGMCARGAS